MLRIVTAITEQCTKYTWAGGPAPDTLTDTGVQWKQLGELFSKEESSYYRPLTDCSAPFSSTNCFC